MSIDTLEPHLARPHVRPFQALPLQKDGQTFIGLRDPMMLVAQTMVVTPQAAAVVQQFQGVRTIQELAEAVKLADPQPLVDLARKLDEFGLLWGPTFERLETELKTRLFERGSFPSMAASSLGDSDEACRRALTGWLAETEDPELEAAPVGIVAPHLDYARGWPNYAAAYRSIDRVEQPDRIVVLGTNHFGIGDGIVATELGFETPMGLVPPDHRVIEGMRRRLGKAAFVDQLDHHAEHSIQLQLPWLQHRFGAVPVVAVLVPDPLRGLLADDDERVGLDRFVEAMGEVLHDLGGRTFYVASADLSHVGPQFGEPRRVDDQRREDVQRHDRDMISRYLAGPEEFLEAMRWCKNPTRWCSAGNMYAAQRLSGAASVELIDYRQACDDQGICLVSSAAMALMPAP